MFSQTVVFNLNRVMAFVNYKNVYHFTSLSITHLDLNEIGILSKVNIKWCPLLIVYILYDCCSSFV